MVIDNHSFEAQLLKLIAETKSELDAKEGRREVLDKEIDELKLEIQGYDIALRGFQKRTGKQEESAIDWSKLLLTAKTHKDRIIIVLKQFGGIARPNQITDILYTKDFIKSKRRGNAYQIVQTNLAQLIDKKLVEKTEDGYRLIGAQPVLAIKQK